MRNKEISLKILRRIIHTPSTYRILRSFLELLNSKEKASYKVWVRFLLNTYQEAYKHKRPVIWINSFFPTEIVYGFDGIPILPEILSALVTYLGWSEFPLSRAEARVSTDLCSFYRCALGLALERFLPRPDLILSSSHLCDGANKFFNYLSRIYQCPHLILDPPYHTHPSSQRYMEGQLKNFTNEVSRLLNLPLKEERFSHILNCSNQTRQFIVKVNELRRSIPSPFPGNEGLSYLSGMTFHSMGSAWALRFFSLLQTEIETNVIYRRGYLPEEKHRLLWLHHVRPYYKNEIFNIFYERHVAVSFEEANYLYWPPFDPSEPWKSLAKKILSNVWAGPLERRLKAIEEMILHYSIKGVIHFSHWGCRQSCGGAAMIGDWLKEKRIPYLILPGDCTDPNNYSPGQTRTRLEAFIEMLE
ncbi:MAG: 2-hydroxyacyl-CoA dehydratase subunit D [Thermodesulfobacteriota bacterium]